jgi:hypothetical protein
VGGELAPVLLVAILAAILIAQLVLELFTQPAGAASVWSPDAAIQAHTPASSSAH